MERLLGSEYPTFLATYDQPRTRGLRGNPLKLDPSSLCDRLQLPLEPIPWAPGGFCFPEGARPGRHPYHAAGLYYIQEPSAMVAAAVLAPEPGERVLDLCAAPGGKATHLAALMGNRGLLVANEIHPCRARILVENLERMAVTCAVVLNERPDRLAARLPDFFDKVLVDAPCSGEGMFRKLPEARAEWSPGAPRACAAVQREILAEAVRMLRPGGRLLYSTCTFAPEENEQVLHHLLEHHPELELLELPPVPGMAPARPDWSGDPGASVLARAGRLWPHRLRGEGHFIALLQKRADLPPTRTPTRGVVPEREGGPVGSEAVPREAAQAFERFCRESLTCRPEVPLRLHGGWLYSPPPEAPDLTGLHVLRSGLQLGEVRKGRFEPAHALALTLGSGDTRQVHDLPGDSEAVLAYLRGEPLPARGQKGWTLVTVDSFPLGWAKAADGLLKNHYPKGLRWLTTPVDPEE